MSFLAHGVKSMWSVQYSCMFTLYTFKWGVWQWV